jgi:hypothetical protein
MQRAVRCCPHAGELWARLLRQLEVAKQDPAVIGEIYMRALACGVLTRKGAPDVAKSKDKGKAKVKDHKKGKGKASKEDVEMQEPRLFLGDARGADVAELAALEAAWAGYMRRMAEADDDDEEEDKEDAVEITLRDGIARCRERE